MAPIQFSSKANEQQDENVITGQAFSERVELSETYYYYYLILELEKNMQKITVLNSYFSAARYNSIA